MLKLKELKEYILYTLNIIDIHGIWWLNIVILQENMNSGIP